MINIPKEKTSVKFLAVIYCRVSTDDQEREGTSLESQRQACLEYCKQRGYAVTHQMIEVWTGLSIERPKLDELRQLVRNREINAVVVYCLDRLTRDPAHGVILTQEFENNHVSLEAVTETVESTEIGKLISYVRGFAAKLEAEKIRERTMRGTRDRVTKKRLPVTYRQPLGYDWDRKNNRLVPNGDHETVKLLFRLAIQGKSYDYIIAEFKCRGILSPTGQPEWNKHTISSIIHNPVYAGQYYALKSRVREPLKRNGKTYGKSSVERLPLENWYHLPEVGVVDPPITLEQRALLLAQLQKRQNLSQRNARRSYLLRGLIFCDTHKGKKGEPRRYHGQPYHSSWKYVCPVSKCDSPYLDGPHTEEYMKEWVSTLFHFTDDKFYKLITDEGMKGKTRKAIDSEIDKLEREGARLLDNLVFVEDRLANGLITTEEHDRLRLKYQGRRTLIKERQDMLLGELSQLEHEKGAVDTFARLRDMFLTRLRRSVGPINWQYLPEAGPEVREWYEEQTKDDIKASPLSAGEWRELFTTLNFRLTIYPRKSKGRKSANFGLGRKMVTYGISMALPVDASDRGIVKNIALHDHESVLHNISYYPIRFSLSDSNIKLAGVGNG